MNCCPNNPNAPVAVDGEGEEEPAVAGSASAIIVGLLCAAVIVCVFCVSLWWNKRNARTEHERVDKPSHHPHAVLAQRQSRHAHAKPVAVPPNTPDCTTKALRCTATAWMLTVAEGFANF